MVKKILFLLLSAVSALTAQSQSIQWLVKPNFDDISHLSNSIFKCKKNGKVQLVDNNGQSLLALPVDSVTNFNEGFALVLTKTSNGFKISEIVDASGRLTHVNEIYRANQYSFFSERLVSVTAPSGKSGYLDAKGNLAIPCQYRIARPFIKGWASVEPNKDQKQTIYIDRQCNTLKIKNFHHGKVIMGSSFNEFGEALVAFYDNDNAIIDTQGKIVRNYERKGNKAPIRARDFAFDENNGIQEKKALHGITYNSEILPFAKGSLFGYRIGEHIVAPPQFDFAGQFADGCAIIRNSEGFGIIKLTNGDFSGSFEGDDLFATQARKMPTYVYTLTIPQNLKLADLQVMFDTGDGNLRVVEMRDNTYSFTPFVDKDATFCLMRMQVMYDGLLVWADSLEKSVLNISISSPMALSEKADEHDILRIQSEITNNSKLPIVVSGSFVVAFAKGSANKVDESQTKPFKNISIAPKSKLKVFASIHVENEETAKATVTVKSEQKTIGTRSANILFKPFYP